MLCKQEREGAGEIVPQGFSWTDITQTTGGLPQLCCQTLFFRLTLIHSLPRCLSWAKRILFSVLLPGCCIRTICLTHHTTQFSNTASIHKPSMQIRPSCVALNQTYCDALWSSSCMLKVNVRYNVALKMPRIYLLCFFIISLLCCWLFIVY